MSRAAIASARSAARWEFATLDAGQGRNPAVVSAAREAREAVRCDEGGVGTSGQASGDARRAELAFEDVDEWGALVVEEAQDDAEVGGHVKGDFGRRRSERELQPIGIAGAAVSPEAAAEGLAAGDAAVGRNRWRAERRAERSGFASADAVPRDGAAERVLSADEVLAGCVVAADTTVGDAAIAGAAGGRVATTVGVVTAGLVLAGSGARAPSAEKDTERDSINRAGDVANPADVTPSSEERAEVDSVDHAVAVAITEAGRAGVVAGLSAADGAKASGFARADAVPRGRAAERVNRAHRSLACCVVAAHAAVGDATITSTREARGRSHESRTCRHRANTGPWSHAHLQISLSRHRADGENGFTRN